MRKNSIALNGEGKRIWRKFEKPNSAHMRKQTQRPVSLFFLLLPNSNLLDFAGVAQVFHEARDLGLEINIQFCSFEDHIQTTVNLPLGKIAHFKSQRIQPGDYLFIFSANIDYMLSDKLNPGQDLIDWIVQAKNTGAHVCSLCNGAFLLGKTGLLDHVSCTTHWKRTRELQAYFPLANVKENVLFIEDNGIITSAGSTSGVDVALYVLSKIAGDHFAYKVSRILVVYTRRSGSHAQQSIFLSYRNHVHMGIHRAQDWLQQHLEQKPNLAELAEIAQMSERNFTRIFKKETSVTVNDYMNLLRREKVRELMKNPDLSRVQIANLCGLKSTRHLSRLI